MISEGKNLEGLRIDRERAPRGGSPVAWILVSLAVVAAAIGVWWYYRPRSIEVRTAVVRQTTTGENKTLLNSSGYVTARREATVSSKVTGKVVEILVEEGMSVKEGQILARIDSSNVERSLALAEAQLESARKTLDETQANLNQAEIDFRRTSALAAEKVATQSDLDRAQTEVRSLEARLHRQQADVAVAEREVGLWTQQLDDTIIRAPFGGIVTSKDAQPGEIVSPMSAGGGFTRTGICTIVDMDSLEIEVDVSESYINRVQPDQPVEATLDSYPEWRIPAKVIAIIPTADRQKATVKVRVGFEELDSRILPDMSVKVAFRSAAGTGAVQTALVVPSAAVRKDRSRDIVWIVRENRLERRAVTVGAVGEDEISLAAGVAVGEKVVVEGPENLKEGDPVREADR